MRISDWSSDVCSSDLNPLIDPADRRTRPTARLLDVGLASGDNRNIGCTAAHRRRFGGRIMASRAQPSLWRESVKAGAARFGALFASIVVSPFTIALALALASINADRESGRASWRARVCEAVGVRGVLVELQKKGTPIHKSHKPY